MAKQIVIEGVEFTAAAAANIEETGCDVAGDLARMRSGMTSKELLSRCLDGAVDDRVEGWSDYVSAVSLAAGCELIPHKIGTDEDGRHIYTAESASALDVRGVSYWADADGLLHVTT